ncbi:MAG: pyruvate:ferredoxin (flavodoxin) oxidoreductase, partial [Alphaproteobacteria bacterium]|nr:pyruvate:ferredoxin (flavodoxin) oxidoreductase [Alphaproteobacteria bacterium]
GLIAMMSGAYVAQIALGANQAQAIKAFREAEAFNGPSIILAYSPCIAHGFALQNGVEHQINLVNTGAWPLYRFNPDLLEQNINPLSMDSSLNTPFPLEEFMKSETRFASARSVNSNFDSLVDKAKKDNLYKTKLKKYLAEFKLDSDKKDIDL